MDELEMRTVDAERGEVSFIEAESGYVPDDLDLEIEAELLAERQHEAGLSR
jgi:hypothetical protein